MNIELERVKCNLCGSADSKMLFAAPERVYTAKTAFNYMKCKNCGLVYLNPRPTHDSMKKYFFEDIGRFNTLGLGKLVQEIYRLYYRFERPAYLKEKGKMLDVGAGIGRLMEVYKKRGWEVSGVDISMDACTYAKETWGVDIYNGYLKEAEFNDSYFDLVCLWQFIEHCDDPLSSLREAYRILRPGGILEMGEVVNVDSFEFKLFKQGCIYIAAPFHFYLYSEPVIIEMVKKAGFRILKKRYDCLNPLLLSGSLIDFLNDAFSLAISHRLRQNLSYLVFLVLFPFSFLLKILKSSTTVTIYAQKP